MESLGTLANLSVPSASRQLIGSIAEQASANLPEGGVSETPQAKVASSIMNSFQNLFSAGGGVAQFAQQPPPWSQPNLPLNPAQQLGPLGNTFGDLAAQMKQLASEINLPSQ